MATALGIVRIILHVLVAVIFLVAICLCLTGVLSTGWQTLTTPAKGDIHQHGLWFDYTWATEHAAGKNEKEWHWNFKFGEAVEGDDQHKWKAYQYNTLILISVATFVAFVCLVLSYIAPYSMPVAFIFIGASILPIILSAAGVIMFYYEATQPHVEYITFDSKHIRVYVDYSFYTVVGGVATYFLATLISVAAGVVDIIMHRRGERPTLKRDSYFRVSTHTNGNRPPIHNNTAV